MQAMNDQNLMRKMQAMNDQNLFDLLSRAAEISGPTTSSSLPLPILSSSASAPAAGAAIQQRFVAPVSSAGSAPLPALHPAHKPPICQPAASVFSKPAPSAKSTAASASANPKKRTWKKPADKPKRPLSAYNLFFQAEREKIVAAKVAEIDAAAESSPKKKNGAAAVSPRAVPSPPVAGNNNSNGVKKRRIHRRTHGKIGFAALAQNIAAKWKVLDAVSREPFERRAAVEKERYRREIEEWKTKQKEKQEKQQKEEEEGKKGEEEGAAEGGAKATAVVAARPPPKKKRKLPTPPANKKAAPVRQVSLTVSKPDPQVSSAMFDPISLSSLLMPSARPLPSVAQSQGAVLPFPLASLAASAAAVPRQVPRSEVSNNAVITPPLSPTNLPSISASMPIFPAAPMQMKQEQQVPVPESLNNLDNFEMNMDAMFEATKEEGEESLPADATFEPTPLCLEMPPSPVHGPATGGSADDDVPRFHDFNGEFVDLSTTFEMD